MTRTQLRALADEAEARAGKATPIAGAPGYVVDDGGRVFSLASNWRGYGVRELVPAADTDGYLRVRLTVNGRRRAAKVHKLVAEAFLPPRPPGQIEIRHLDGDRRNNRVVNLAWGTARDNAADRDRHGRTARADANGMRRHPERRHRPERRASGEKCRFARLTEEAVRLIRSQAAAGVSPAVMAANFGVHPATVRKAIKRETWRHV